LSVRSLNLHPTESSQELEVGVKCRWKRGCLANQPRTQGGVPMSATIVQDHVHCKAFGDVGNDGLRTDHGLDLRFLLGAKDNRLVRRLHVKPRDVDQLPLETANRPASLAQDDGLLSGATSNRP
jgi:hypothetical protein